MMTRQDVIDCYRFVLGRPPESEEMIDLYVNSGRTVEQLRLDFMHSDEFIYSYAGSVGESPQQYLPDVLPPNHIEFQLDPKLENEFFADVQRAWEGFGEDESFWSVLTSDEFKSGSLEENKRKFFASGEVEVNRLWNAFERNFQDLDGVKSVLEYGCGVGRVTSWLARQIERVYGVDISANHLKVAQAELAGEAEASRIEWIHCPSVEGLASLPTVDLVFTTIVLQHNPPPVMYRAVERLLGCLNVGGYGYFQVPTYRLNYGFSAQRWLEAGKDGRRNMEMHSLPQRVIFELIEAAGCKVLEVAEDGSTGLRNLFRSNVFFVKRVR
jgi:SAM-dependent methyltransferase